MVFASVRFRAGRLEDDAIVRFLDVDQALQPRLHVDRSVTQLDAEVARSRLIGEDGLDGSPDPRHPDLRIRIEPAGGLIGSLQDLLRPVGELDHRFIVTERGQDRP